MFEPCQKCKTEEARDEDGICPYVKDNDNLPLRCIGKWSEDKLDYLGRYMDIFNTAMKYKRPKRAYLDLFSGPGKCIIKNSGKIILGSTLLAYEQSQPFSLIISVDINDDAISALKIRGGKYNSGTILRTFNADCNLIVDWIRDEVDSSYLSLVFIDPTSMQMKFSTIRKLTDGLSMDLIINYPLQAINRAYRDALSGNETVFNEFFGTTKWKEHILGLKSAYHIATKLLPLYKQQLGGIGYKDITELDSDKPFISDEVLVKGPRNIPLYYLFLASRNPLGSKLWQEVKKIRPDRQGQFL